jgi:hypothetical protein
VADEDQSQIGNRKLETDNEAAGNGLETLAVSYKEICTIVFPGHMTRGGDVVGLGSSLTWAGVRSWELGVRRVESPGYPKARPE